MAILTFKDNSGSQATMAHTCNPSYSVHRDQEDHSSKPAQTNSLRSYLENTHTHHTQNGSKREGPGGVDQVTEHLLSKHKALSSNPEPPKKKKKKENSGFKVMSMAIRH
jgi:hypothetical protein